MEIKPTYVTWEQAKWLKEKGFDVNTHMGYAYFQNLRKYKLMSHRESKDYSAPEQWQVVEWLRVVHGIWIVVDWMTRTKPYNSGYYCHLRGTSKRLNQDNFIVINDTLNPGYEVFNSPQEAYSAAFDYILKELI
jgi:hypothetical protein